MRRRFQRQQAFANQGIGKSQVAIPFPKHPMHGLILDHN
jgi:hypothetical protein